MSDNESIAVVGAGAVGGALAAALGDAGREVTLCDVVSFDSLTRQLDGQTTQYHHRLVTSPEGLAPVDWVLLCTKEYQICAAGDWLESLIGPKTVVGVMQNGVNHEERVSAYVDSSHVVPAIMLLPVEAISPGTIVQDRAGTIQVPDTPAGQAFAKLFPDDGAIVVDTVSDFVSAAWSKLAFNAVAGGIGALALGPLALLSEAPAARLAGGLLEEVVTVGTAEGAVFPDDFVERTLAMCATVPEHWESIAVDRRAGRRMEWQARNAVVGKTARLHGIETPLNDAISALLELIDSQVIGAKQSATDTAT